MMRLDELSDALHQQADTVHDGGAADRLHGVRGRVRAARRRRTAAVSATAVAAIALVGVTVLPGLGDSDTGPAEAPAMLAGHEVPERLEANGFTYEYAEGVTGERGENPITTRVRVGDEPRLVSFASSVEGSTLLAETDHGSRMGGPSGDFGTHLLLQPGGAESVTLRQLDGLGDGTLALAVYDLVEEPPPGVSDGTFTFREEMAGWRLVDGAIGEPGQTDVRLDVTLPEGRLRWDVLCHSGGEDVMVKQSLEGLPGWQGSGCGTPSYGPDASQHTTQSVGEDPAARNRPLEARVWLGPRDGGPGQVAEDDDVVIGMAVYVATFDAPVVPAPGSELDRVYEAHGHAWSVSGFLDVPGRGDRFALTLPAQPEARTVRLVVSTDPQGPTELRFGVGGNPEPESTTMHVGNDFTTLGPFVVLPGKEREVFVEYVAGMPKGAEVTAVVADLAD